MSICVPPLQAMPLTELQKPELDPHDALSAYYRATSPCPCHNEYWCEDYVMRPEKAGAVALVNQFWERAIVEGNAQRSLDGAIDAALKVGG